MKNYTTIAFSALVLLTSHNTFSAAAAPTTPPRLRPETSRELKVRLLGDLLATNAAIYDKIHGGLTKKNGVLAKPIGGTRKRALESDYLANEEEIKNCKRELGIGKKTE